MLNHSQIVNGLITIYLEVNEQASPNRKHLLIIISTYAREDYLLSDRLSLLPG